MKILVNSREMKQCDAATTAHFRIPSEVLMERAALSVVEEIEARGICRKRCLVVCGLGNNGGDGLAIARLLHQKGSRVTVLIDMKKEKATPQTLLQYEIVCRYGIPVVTTIPEESFDLVIDAIFGIGLSRAVEGHWRETIEALNHMPGYKLSVDIPSGIHADTGQLLGCAFHADMTVTFAYEKVGLLLHPGSAYSGNVVVKDIGIDSDSWLTEKPTAFAYEEAELCRLPRRKPYSNKGSYGKVLVIAGKKNMAGAAYFSAKAAAVTGCGLVKILTVEENRTILQQLIPEAVLENWEETELTETGQGAAEAKLFPNMEWADVIVVGPGLGTGPEARKIVDMLLEEQRLHGQEQCDPTGGAKNRTGFMEKPLILDADALNIIARKPGQLKNYRGPVIVTPHLGEMARLTGKPIAELKQNLPAEAVAFARTYGVICVLKDARTVTALPEGTFFINKSGNSGMATAGVGDVLTGVLAGLIAQGMKAEEAGAFGVFFHGLAGDAAAEKKGSYSMTASDIIDGVVEITRKESRHEHL